MKELTINDIRSGVVTLQCPPQQPSRTPANKVNEGDVVDICGVGVGVVRVCLGLPCLSCLLFDPDPCRVLCRPEIAIENRIAVVPLEDLL